MRRRKARQYPAGRVNMRPVIGIPCYSGQRVGSQVPIHGNNQSYIRAVQRAGGVALLVPPHMDADALETVCSRLDGLLLSGGCDIDPARYGEEPIAACQDAQPERDELELALAAWALDAAVPILGICRGMQLLNVACGGTLLQDLATQQPEAAQHDYAATGRTFRAHGIRLQEHSRLSEILGATPYTVNSLHHQAVACPGDGVEIVGWSPDGVAEAMEVDGHPFAVAVQFHPEELEGDPEHPDEPSRALFRAFVQACRERMPR
ncbi:MAG TPA: gamma-glutamyl-gamma-aminobutyrate hydrolase family protein [Ktedonobacterales bacterium]|nr:gamma-glutamyl-gamma-aminobutyrate hydrolase family protein [Ktedonobacterales bacterium]